MINEFKSTIKLDEAAHGSSDLAFDCRFVGLIDDGSKVDGQNMVRGGSIEVIADATCQ